MPIFNPAGGIRTNVQDLSHFLIAHMNSGKYNEVQILDKETVELIHTVQYPNNSGLYGLGWFKLSIAGESYDLHPGGTYGFSSFMIIRNSDNVGVICFFNQCTTPYMKSNIVLSIEVKISYLIPLVLFMNANKF
jgi:CubicO group peptidase (beta-lactamase class C family)